MKVKRPALYWVPIVGAHYAAKEMGEVRNNPLNDAPCSASFLKSLAYSSKGALYLGYQGLSGLALVVGLLKGLEELVK